MAVLLSTSGSTGSPRLVRLSYSALQENASSIAVYLGLNKAERPITTLPMHYSYGLSVINSHLAVGATLVLNTDSVISRSFLERLKIQGVTSLSGVPYTYQMLWRTGFFNQELPHLRTLTQAGGRLDEKLLRLLSGYASTTGRRFFVMYGQTEACARISYVPPDCLNKKIGSIGVPIPGGKLEVEAETGELIYYGSNVMLGYAECRSDLALGDENQGCLRTGDLGWVDDDGFYYVTGRIKRFIKISGNRIGLDEVENALQVELGMPIAVGGSDDSLIVWVENSNVEVPKFVREYLRKHYSIHPTMCVIKLMQKLPLLPTGKKNYSALLSI